MSEKPIKEIADLKELNAKYTQCCARAGDLQFRLLVMQSDLKRVNDEINEINIQATNLQAAAKAAQTPEVLPPAPEAVQPEATV